MPFSVELFFDPSAQSVVRRAWDEVEDAGFSRSTRAKSARPHITLGIWKQIDVAAAGEVVRGFTPRINGLKLNFASVGTFAKTSVVFFAPTVTLELLELHRAFHEQFTKASTDVWGHYLPGHWTPHCTIGEKVDPRDVPDVLDIALYAGLPLVAQVKEIGIVQHPGAVEVVTYADDGGEVTKATQ